MNIDIFFRLWLFGMLLTCISACQTVSIQTEKSLTEQHRPTLPNWRAGQFTVQEVVSQQQIFELNESQRQHFLSYYHSPSNQHLQGHKRLFNYLEDTLQGFSYKGQTLTAEHALESLSGNCLSLAILTTSLANLVEIDMTYQRVNTAPIYQRFHNVMTLSSHVRTHVYAPQPELKKGEVIILRSKLVIDYFPDSNDVKGDTVSRQDFIAMFYQNLAGDALVQKNYPKAYSFLAKAMEINPSNPETINTIAVLHKALGNLKITEDLYQYGLNNIESTVNILSNYALLLEQQQRLDELQEIEGKLDKIKDDNPYRWVDIANRQYAKQKYAIALKYYKRAVEVAPYLHEGYFGLAKTYYKIGLHQQAKSSMERASELAFSPDDEHLYKAKLNTILALSD